MMPAMRPPRTVVMLLDGVFNSAGLMVDTELITLSFFCFPKATTVTASSSFSFGDSVKRITPPFVTGRVCGV